MKYTKQKLGTQKQNLEQKNKLESEKKLKQKQNFEQKNKTSNRKMKLRLRAHKKLRAHKAGGASVRSIVAAEVGNLLCHTCATQVELSHKFCVQCGCELDCEEMFIRHYFFKGYCFH